MQNPYDCVFDEITNTYNFTTKNDILYRVAFIVDETFSTISGEEIPNIYQLVIEKASDNLERFDAGVSKTIENIVERFFEKVENSLIYICSEDNRKAKQRHEIFDRWYKKSNQKEIVVKIDNIITIALDNHDSQKLYTSFMFHKNNPFFHKLLGIYSRMEQVLNSDK